MLLIIAALSFGAVALLVLGLTLKSEQAIIRERIWHHAQLEPDSFDSVHAEMEVPFRQRVVRPVLGRLAQLGLRMTPSGTLQATEARLETAGRPWRLGAKEYLGLKALSVIVFVLAAIVIAGFLNTSIVLRVLLLTIVASIGILLPDAALNNAIGTRQNKIRKVLPDTLDLMLVSVEAGLGLDGAIQKVTDKMRNPLAQELNRALQEMQVGKLRVDALREVAKRAKVQELSAFVAAVCQADTLGVSIAQVLRVQSETMRTQRSLRTRELASKLPVKMLFPLVFFIFPAIFVVLLAPAVMIIAGAFGYVTK